MPGVNISRREMDGVLIDRLDDVSEGKAPGHYLVVQPSGDSSRRAVGVLFVAMEYWGRIKAATEECIRWLPEEYLN